MKAYEPLNALVAVLSPILVFAQATEPTNGRNAEELRRALERFIPKTFLRMDAEDRVNLLKDLEPLLEKLEETRTLEDSRKSDSKGTLKLRKGFQENVRINFSENSESTSVANVWLRIWSYESFKRAEEGYAQNASMIQIALEPGSLAGQEVGELSHHYAKDDSPFIIFLRRNVVASLACRVLIYSHSDAGKEPGSRVGHLALKKRCENFAKKIDEAIIYLTNK